MTMCVGGPFYRNYGYGGVLSGAPKAKAYLHRKKLQKISNKSKEYGKVGLDSSSISQQDDMAGQDSSQVKWNGQPGQ